MIVWGSDDRPVADSLREAWREVNAPPSDWALACLLAIGLLAAGILGALIGSALVRWGLF